MIVNFKIINPDLGLTMNKITLNKGIHKGITTAQMAIILAGFLLTLVSWYLFKNSVEHSARADFKRQATIITDQVKYKVNRNILLLYSFKGLFAASKSVERKASTICFAKSSETNLAGMEIMLASLCCLASSAISTCQQSAHLMF